MCLKFSFSLFNSFNAINMGWGESSFHDYLASSSSSLTEKQKCISQVFVQLWLLRPMAGDSHYWVAGEEALVSSRTHESCGQFHMCFLVADTTESWRRREHRVARGSVESQEWLGVLILSLVLMFQGPSFYHRLRSNNRKREKM